MKRVLWFIFLFTICCGKREKEASQKKIIGINGEAVYVFKGESIIKVFKEEYNRVDFAVLLDRDTVVLGTDFESLIHVSNENYKVTIKSPSNYQIISDGKSELRKYTFTPKAEGVYSYRGTVEYDTMAVPFEYKFIVIKK